MTLPDTITDSANQSLPEHVAIIMDGNGRWAQQRGKIRVAGHKAGVVSRITSYNVCYTKLLRDFYL